MASRGRSRRRPRICLIATEFFAWGKHGGFGRAARTIGRELVRRGFTTYAVVPRRRGQRAVERLDGIVVLGFSPWLPWRALHQLRRCDADIYHSCEVSTSTWLALRAMPGRRHMATFRDPRDARDWRLELARPSLGRPQVLRNWLYESGPCVPGAVRRLDALYTIAHHLIPKVERMYRPRRRPRFLPTPVALPEVVRKADEPTVAWVARLDRRKRPERFVELARRFPAVRFIAAGRSRDPRFEAHLRRLAAGVPNLELAGFVDQFAESGRHAAILDRSWILMNAATREALPNSFLEAAAHGCAILGSVDPDGFCSRFGYHAADDDFERGLAWLLENDRWRERGAGGRRHVAATFETGRAMERHLAAYAELLRPGVDRPARELHNERGAWPRSARA
jgi:glycosyltransferase involved in cell wall biosynthesis